MEHAGAEELEAGLNEVRRAPPDNGTVELIVRRPAEGEREVLAEGELDLVEGLMGDSWRERASRGGRDRSPEPDAQVTVMNARFLGLIARERDRWPLAGDQLLVDLDLSADNLPPGSQLALGTAVIEVTALPHTGCVKFSSRFGVEALRFVNSPAGRALRLRGLNARVVQPGTVRTGDRLRKLGAAAATGSRQGSPGAAEADEASAGAQLPIAEFAFPGPQRDELVAAILAGQKTSTTGLHEELLRTGEPLPRVGERQAVVDSAGRVVAVIETTELRVLPLAAVDLAFALEEGEGFETVAEWRAAHERFFASPEMRAVLGEPPVEVGDETLVVAERFRLVERA